MKKEIKITLNVNNSTVQDKYFIHNGKKYPVNFDLLKRNTHYFYDNRKQYKNIEAIELLNESEKPLNISEESIQAFASICQNDPYQIQLSSVIPLQFLAHKFEHSELLRQATEIINDHLSELVLQKLLFKTVLQDQFKAQPFFDTKSDERYVSENFTKYMNDDELFSLPFPVIERIFALYMNSKNIDKIDSKSFIQFFFNCLDRYGKQASVLFNGIDFKDDERKVRDRLIQNYSDVFDFNLFDSALEKTTSQIIDDLEEQKKEFNSVYSQKISEFNNKYSEFNELKKDIIQKKSMMIKIMKKSKINSIMK